MGHAKDITENDLSYVIKRPVLTEKSSLGSSDHGRYTFEVDVRATKRDIKAAVESLYRVHVEKVNTRVRKARDRQYRYGLVTGKISKHATVRLRDGEAIDLL
ncbi:MAG: 50S ribosomal protein L23 [Planctomyces sp.]|nr:50S ribosomal protein L23 [Planctomyces sp.]MBA4119421.1 50S ribosomal protein L23 [Isosphaera sp.]